MGNLTDDDEFFFKGKIGGKSEVYMNNIVMKSSEEMDHAC